MAKRLTWRERLDRAKRHGCFHFADHQESQQFVTCAVGERHQDGFMGFVKYGTAYRLGRGFFAAVQADSLVEAERIYQEIQALELKEGGS